MAQLFKSVKRLERHKKDEFVFTNNGVAKQAKFLTTVQDWMHEELQMKLEAKYGQLPSSLKDVISAGENLLTERLHLLKIAYQYGWGAVTEFTEVELARNEVEEKKLKKIMKDSELKRAKAREVKLKGVRKPYYQVTGVYRADSPNNRYDICVERPADAYKPLPGNVEGRKTSCASSAGSQVTFRRTAGAGELRPMEVVEAETETEIVEEEDEAIVREGDDGAQDGIFKYSFHVRNNKVINYDTHPREFLSLDKLDSLEGIKEEVNIEHDYCHTRLHLGFLAELRI